VQRRHDGVARRLAEVQVVVVAESGWDLGRLDDSQARYLGKRPRVPREVSEEGSLGEEDRRVALLGCPAGLEAEEAGIGLVLY
jgi:hypothetical protein